MIFRRFRIRTGGVLIYQSMRKFRTRIADEILMNAFSIVAVPEWKKLLSDGSAGSGASINNFESSAETHRSSSPVSNRVDIEEHPSNLSHSVAKIEEQPLALDVASGNRSPSRWRETNRTKDSLEIIPSKQATKISAVTHDTLLR